MKVYLNLRDNIACERICQMVQKLINDSNNRGSLVPDKSLLIVEITNIDQEIDIHTPRIEYKESGIVN